LGPTQHTFGESLLKP